MITATAMLAALPASAPGTDPTLEWSRPIAEAAQRFAIPEDWIRRVIRAESGGRTSVDKRPIRSPVGAMGLMQLMPATWADMRERDHLGDDPDDPRENILAGTAYLSAMYARFGYPGLFAAYNAGPARYAASLTTGRPLPGETIAYLAKLSAASMPTLVDVPARPRSTPPALLFAIRHDATSVDHQPSQDAGQASLFAVRSVSP